jgi:hypothetical protein
MWNLAKTCVIVAACLVTVDIAAAVGPFQPFVHVTVPPDPLYLGQVVGPGLQQIGSCLTARVVANCPYHIEASFLGLQNSKGGTAVSAKHLSVKINGKAAPVGGGRVTIAQSNRPTTSAGEDVPVDLQVGVVGSAQYPAGRYRGTLVITVMAGP